FAKGWQRGPVGNEVRTALSWPHYSSERLGEGVRDLVTTEPEQSGSFFNLRELEPPLSETPSTKPQAPEKFQISNTNLKNKCRGKRRVQRFLSLELFAWALSFSKTEMFLLSFRAPNSALRAGSGEIR